MQWMEFYFRHHRPFPTIIVSPWILSFLHAWTHVKNEHEYLPVPTTRHMVLVQKGMQLAKKNLLLSPDTFRSLPFGKTGHSQPSRQPASLSGAESFFKIAIEQVSLGLPALRKHFPPIISIPIIYLLLPLCFCSVGQGFPYRVIL